MKTMYEITTIVSLFLSIVFNIFLLNEYENVLKELSNSKIEDIICRILHNNTIYSIRDRILSIVMNLTMLCVMMTLYINNAVGIYNITFTVVVVLIFNLITKKISNAIIFKITKSYLSKDTPEENTARTGSGIRNTFLYIRYFILLGFAWSYTFYTMIIQYLYKLT